MAASDTKHQGNTNINDPNTNNNAATAAAQPSRAIGKKYKVADRIGITRQPRR
jgi:hypothetical protein